MKHPDGYLLPISILVASIIISLTIYGSFSIDIFQKIFSILGSFSLGVAVVTYFYKKQDETLAAIGQISFFREKIIPEWASVCKEIKKTDVGKKYWFSRIDFSTPTFEAIRETWSRNLDNQLSIFFDPTKENYQDWVDVEMLDRQILLLNLLEEFSLTVTHFKSIDHPALYSLHSVFVEIVEKNIGTMIFMRDIATGNPVYDSTIALYASWKGSVEKSNMILNLEKHSFITKEKGESIRSIQRARTKPASQS